MRKTSFDKTLRASSLFSVLFVMLISLAVTACVYFLSGTLSKGYALTASSDEASPNSDDSSDSGGSAGIFNKKAQKGEYPEFDYSQFDEISEGQFVYVVNRSIYLDDAKSPANIMLINPEENSFFISLDIEIEGKCIYSSGIIKRNSYIDKDVFSAELEPGTYNAVGKITAYDSATAEPVETYETELTITVGK